MIKFERFVLSNGLKVIVHKDTSTPVVAMNILYNVGARDEDADRTGFAHLFEHLMFGGSINIPKYDEPLQKVGGENNAFTNSDITNYYLTLPKPNLETAFWLESDRMAGLAFSEKSLDVQRNVVTEEFNQSYLNQPYGDVYLLLKPLAYKVHPYQWNTIGKDISHIQGASMDDVKAFFNRFYCPNNAIMVVAGDVDLEEIKQLSEKWFAPIPKGPANNRQLPQEPRQTEARTMTVERKVPLDSIYKVWHCCGRTDDAFPAVDLLSDVLSNGKSARMFQELLMKKQLFSDINAYVSADMDPGLFIVAAKLTKGVSMQEAEEAIIEELQKVQQNVSEEELEKVKNKVESTMIFSEMSVLNKAMNLAFAELLGDANLVNTDLERYRAVTSEMIMQQAKEIFRDENCSTLYYKAIE